MCLLCDYYPLILVISVQISLLKGMHFQTRPATDDARRQPAFHSAVCFLQCWSKEMFLVFQVICSFYHRVPIFIYIWGLFLNKFMLGSDFRNIVKIYCWHLEISGVFYFTVYCWKWFRAHSFCLYIFLPWCLCCSFQSAFAVCVCVCVCF